MVDLSPSERALTEGTLVLFPDGEPDERGPVSGGLDGTQPVLHVQALLRDVRDEAQSKPDRDAWFERAWELAAPLPHLAWFTLHLAMVRHAVLLRQRDRARTLAIALVDGLHERPSVDITNQDSMLRDALRRAQRALRVPILARAIKLDIGDVLPRIIDLAESDRTIDDRSRVDVLLRVLGGVRKLRADEAPIVQMLVASGTSLDRYWSSTHNAWFKREASKRYLARPIYEYDRIPQQLHWRRVTERRPSKEY